MGTKQVQLVCVRAVHHRHQAAECLCDVAGFTGYCPAGDVGGHDWMPVMTDLSSLARIGFLRDDEGEHAPADLDAPEPIGT